jgi:hypothetical protein
LHAGEIELRGDDIAGIGVHLAARVMGKAADDEIWVSPPSPVSWSAPITASSPEAPAN